MNKLLLSIATLGVVGALAVGATSAIFSDEEVSTGNTFTAGAVDLKIDNTSYYNGELNLGTTWLEPRDLNDGDGPAGGQYLFFNFDDLKPGDYGEDTISLHVDNNDSWLCVDVTLTSNEDNGLTEPEMADGDNTDGPGEGELADAVTFIWWADDGDNVLEIGEEVLTTGTLGALDVGNTFTQALADSQNNIWGEDGEPFPGDEVRYIGKAWCFGNMELTPVEQDNLGPVGTPGEPGSNGPDFRGAGFTCDGSIINNETQTDSMTADIVFHAVQSRHNENFVCQALPPEPEETGTLRVQKTVVNNNGGDLTEEDFSLFVNLNSYSFDEVIELPVGDHIVSESGSNGYDAQFGGACDGDGNVTVLANQEVVCTITNDDIAPTITLVKDVINDNGGVAVPTSFIMRVDGAVVPHNSTKSVTANADHSITEDVFAGYQNTGVSGAGCPVSLPGTVNLNPGEAITCTITNDDVPQV